MLSARRTSDGQIVTAYAESKRSGPFRCVECGEAVVLKSGNEKVNHFAHVNPRACDFATGESDTHRLCKMEIYEALRREPDVEDVVLERPLKTVRADVSAYIRGVPVAIEVQISNLSLETIQHRTEEYARKGIYVLWLLQWTPELDKPKYSPSRWEKWIHTAYFGNVYYWKEGLTVVSYRFEPSLKSVSKKTWYSSAGMKRTGGGYTKRLKRYRTVVRGEPLHLVRDFVHRERGAWQGGGMKLPFLRLFLYQQRSDFLRCPVESKKVFQSRPSKHWPPPAFPKGSGQK